MTTPEETPPNDTPQKHLFPREIAREHGVKEAIVLRYLAYKVGRSIAGRRNKRDGKYWYYGTLEEIVSRRYPYIGRSTLGEILGRMETAGLIERDNFNRWNHDKTTWYTVSDEHRNAAEEELIALDVRVATNKKLGLPAAILICNLRYWLEETGQPSHRMPPTKLARHLPYDRGTLARGLQRLVAEGLIVEDPEKRGYYSIRESAPGSPTQESVPGMAEPGTHVAPRAKGVESVDGARSDQVAPNADLNAAKSDGTAANPDGNAAIPDDITLCKPLERPLDNTFEKIPFKNRSGFDLTPESNPTQIAKDSLPVASTPRIPSDDLDTRVKAKGQTASKDTPSSPPSFTYEGLKQYLAGHAGKLREEDLENLGNHVRGLCGAYIQTIDGERIVRLKFMAIKSPDVLLVALKKPVDDFVTTQLRRIFTTNERTQAKDQAEVIYTFSCLQVLVEAFRHLNDSGYRYTSPISQLRPTIYSVTVDLTRPFMAFVNEFNRKEHEEAKRTNRSKDADKEGVATLVPVEKMRVFRNAVLKRNEVGWLLPRRTPTTIEKNLILPGANAYDRIKEWFALNPEVPVSWLLGVLDQCAELSLTPCDEERDPQFHARKGVLLPLFIKHLDRICDELNTDSSHITFLPKPAKDQKSKGEKGDEP